MGSDTHSCVHWSHVLQLIHVNVATHFMFDQGEMAEGSPQRISSPNPGQVLVAVSEAKPAAHLQ